MEDFKNGAISEEALDQVAGGLNIDRDKLIKGLKIAGVAILGAGAVGVAYKMGSAVSEDTLAHARQEGVTEGENKILSLTNQQVREARRKKKGTSWE